MADKPKQTAKPKAKPAQKETKKPFPGAAPPFKKKGEK